MTITAETIKELREKTGAGVMDCKQALTESNGDFEKAIEFLRRKGLSVAARKATRTAGEGMIGSYDDSRGTVGILVEVNCETDFVVKTEDFQSFVRDVVDLIRKNDFQDLEHLLSAPYRGRTLREAQVDLIAKIGENIGVRRFVKKVVDGERMKLGKYIHAGNKIGVIVTLEDPDNALTNDVAKEIAMHIAAMNPQYVRKEDVPESVIAKEREIHLAQIKGEKKPPEIMEKIVAGKINKYLNEICLEEQIFVKDPEGKKSVKDFLKAISPRIRIREYVRMQVGG